MPGGASAAFFDLDRTLMSGSSGYFWARAAAGAGLMSRRQLASDAYENVLFRLRGSTDEGTRKVSQRVGDMLTGKRVVDFARLGPQVLAGVLPRLYPQMLAIAWDHQDAGRRVFIATAASQDTADMVAHVLGFDGAVGTGLEEVDGVYTGRLSGPMAYREGKAQAVALVAEREGIDLAQSWAYSDSESDLPMLRAVGHPVAVNPDGPLLRVAREEGWEVVRLDRLGGRLKMAGALAAAAALGAAGRRLAPMR
ncbi:HAD family phosphatase [Conexibacter sp. SYSU D00693]|uniref:HAD family hydrolase n=1 Tax=Conexibacter sp. SYSU D00693 TaxID=2812560 RepID=UPI001F11E2F0|nr:HAD family hydrolase [Conexibacter sp. SYSU D00693]